MKAEGCRWPRGEGRGVGLETDLRPGSGRATTIAAFCFGQRCGRWVRAATAVAAVCLSVAVLLATPSPVLAASSKDTKTEVTFLLNFARYVEWPDRNASSSITLCVLRGGLSYRMARDAARGHKVAGHRIAVRSISDVADGKTCHILFLPESQSGHQAAVIRSLASHGVFTVSESEGFAEKGGIANFVYKKGKIRFAINRDAAGRAGLKVSSRLLRIAQIVD